MLTSGDFDVAPLRLERSTRTRRLDAESSCEGPHNFTGYCQRLVTRDLDQTDQIVDPRQRARVLNRADAKLARDVPVIPLFQTSVPGGAQSDRRGVVARGGIFNFSRTPRTGGSSASLTRRGALRVLERPREVPGLRVVVGEPLDVLVE